MLAPLAIPPKNVHLTENPNHGLGLCDTAQDKGELEDGTVVNLALIRSGGNLLSLTVLLVYDGADSPAFHGAH